MCTGSCCSLGTEYKQNKSDLSFSSAYARVYQSAVLKKKISVTQCLHWIPMQTDESYRHDKFRVMSNTV